MVRINCFTFLRNSVRFRTSNHVALKHPGEMAAFLIDFSSTCAVDNYLATTNARRTQMPVNITESHFRTGTNYLTIWMQRRKTAAEWFDFCRFCTMHSKVFDGRVFQCLPMMHCRLEPLLARIKESRTAVLCPLVDAINDKTLEHSSYKGMAVGGFTWSLHFTWDPVPQRELKRRKLPSDPIRYASCCQPSL